MSADKDMRQRVNLEHIPIAQERDVLQTAAPWNKSLFSLLLLTRLCFFGE
jgi:hypothetical protein